MSAPATAAPPATLAPDPAGIPDELTARPQWACWRAQPKPGKPGKVDKVPVDPKTGADASSTDPTTWGTFADACAALRRWPDLRGVGFMLSADDPYVGIDLDACHTPETGIVAPWAMAIVERFGSLAEFSQSLTGIHLLIRGAKPGDRCRTGAIEVYDHARFFVVTGNVLPGYETIRDGQGILDEWYAETFPPKPTPAAIAPSPLAVDDRDLLTRCEGSEKFRRLWAGDWSGCGYPSQSEADLAFCNIVVRNGGDRGQADRMMRASGLMRSKWEREDYREQDTLDTAFDGSVTPYEPPRRPVVPPAPIRADMSAAAGDSCPAQLAAAQHRIAELEAEVARLREENSLIANVAASPHLKGKAPTILRTVSYVAKARERGEVRADGFVCLRPGKVADDQTDGVDPVLSRSTLKRHTEELAAAGLMERKVEEGYVPKVVRDEEGRPVTDPATGRWKTVPVKADLTWVRMTGDSVLDMLKPFAFFRPPESTEAQPRPHGGDRRSDAFKASRTPCPDCGGTERRTYCVGCGVDITETAEADEADLLAAFHVETRRRSRRPTPPAGTAFQDEPQEDVGTPLPVDGSLPFQDETRSRPIPLLDAPPDGYAGAWQRAAPPPPDRYTGGAP